MKKVFFMLCSLLLLGSGTVLAEESKNGEQIDGTEESLVTVDSQKESQAIEKSVIEEKTKESTDKEEKANSTLNTSQKVKDAISREVASLDVYIQKGYITEAEYNSYNERLNAAQTIEEVHQISKELMDNNTNVFSYKWSFGEMFINLKINIQDSQKAGEITDEQAVKLLQDLELARTKEAIQKVSDEFNSIITAGGDSFLVTTEEVNSAKRYLEIIAANNFITQEQYDNLLKELESVKTKGELSIFLSHVHAVSTEPNMFMWTFWEQYINVRANISSCLKDGKITDEQANELYAELDAAKTKDELNVVNDKLNKLIKGTTDSTTTTSSDISDKNKKDGSGDELPKTGEKSGFLLPIIGSMILLNLGISYLIVKYKKLN